MLQHSSAQAVLLEFRRRLLNEWLPSYANDPKRNYGVDGFVEDSLRALSAVDALDFMRAVDHGLLVCDSGGRFRAPRSMAMEVIFWEHERNVIPRKITLWLEPVITIAAVARLHLDYGWPMDLIGMQSPGYAFDLVGYDDSHGKTMRIAGEVKKTHKELVKLINNLSLCCSAGKHDCCMFKANRKNAHKKWAGFNDTQVPVFWAIGPDGEDYVFSIEYHDKRAVEMRAATSVALSYKCSN